MKHPIDPNRPTCVNVNCGRAVHVQGRSSTGRPRYRPVCAMCHKSETCARPGVVGTKKMHCENSDSRLGFKCTATIIHYRQLDMDHIDGDHFHNIPENIQTLCKNCHSMKSFYEKDHLNQKRYDFSNDVTAFVVA